MRKFVVFLIFLLVLLVVADRALHYAAETQLARELGTQYELTADPQVDIGGIPFLTQAVSGNYSEIHVVTGAFSYSEIQLERIDVRLQDVAAPLPEMLQGDPSIVAGRADGTVLLPYSELQRRLPEGIAIEQEGGTPRISGSVVIAGFDVPVQSDIDLEVAGSTLAVRVENLEIDEVPVDVGSVEEQLTFDLPVPALPFGLEVTEVETLPNGVQISAEGEDVPLSNANGAGG